MQAFEQRGQAILKRLPPSAVAVEVGVLRGILSEYLLSQNKSLKLFMVDNWQTMDKQPECYKATGDDHALHDDPARVASHRKEAERRASRFPGRAYIMPVSSIDAASTMDHFSLNMAFLDADHSYEGVLADIQAWLPKVKPGGWIGGHDYANDDPRFRFGVTEAVDEWARETGRTIETDKNFTWFCRV